MSGSAQRPMTTALRLLAAVVVAATWAFAACSNCDGDVIDGRCIPHCDDADCGGGHCFDGACRSVCQQASDCTGGAKCQRVKTRSGYEGLLCLGGTESSAPASAPGAACGSSDECDTTAGMRCVTGRCTLTCDLHEHCCSAGVCTGSGADAEGRAVGLCEADGAPRAAGQYGTHCPYGTECDGAGGFVCVGAGPGDIDAYCTASCGGDGDCPTGTFCALERSAAVPCTSICGGAGTSGGSCIPDERIGEGGDYECGPIGLQRRVCRARSFCTPCQTNADCRGVANQVCARDASGNKICTRLCDPGAGSCPWGTATSCDVWDTELGVPTCAHRYGSCEGTGEGCEPCIDESGCPSGFCDRSQFTGERFCVDYSVACSCPTGTSTACVGGGCPQTPAPGSQDMVCFGGEAAVGSAYEAACVGAATARSQEGEPDGCWP